MAGPLTGAAASSLALGSASKPAMAVNFTSALLSDDQHTLRSVVRHSGVGLHTGQQVSVTVHPAPIHSGRYFVRTDVESGPVMIPAQIDALHQTMLSTELMADGIAIRTVEHLLASLVGLGIDNARIEIDGPEIPLLDGSAQDWVQAILAAGWVAQSSLRQVKVLDAPITVHKGDAFVTAVPAQQRRFTYGIDFANPVIGQQWQSILETEFVSEIASARTFGFAQEVEKLRAGGLIKGGSLENALVCSDEGWLNPPLRYPNEPVRHKLLDLIGDLSLLGALPKAHFFAYKASHALHTQLVQSLAQSLA
jgi:UDP-3-O-[3-hydroxymyristoyl] N-acetylglucosamine deacetylase